MVENDNGTNLDGLGVDDLIKPDDKNNSNQGQNNNANNDANNNSGSSEEEKKRLADEATAKAKIDEDAKNAQNAAQITEVQINDEVYKLDDKGNAVDKNGKIFKTADELKQMDEVIEEEPLVNDIIKAVGIEIKGDDGKAKVYEDSVEGIIEYNKDVANILAKQILEKERNSDPDVKALHEHKQRGGTLEDFINRKNNSWKSVKFDKKNEDQLKKIITSDLLATGMSKEQADLTVNMYKDTKKLEEFGELAYNRLTKKEDELEAKEKQDYEFKRKQDEDNTIKHWNNVQALVKKGTINNITIPEADRDSFFEYIAMSADEHGNSKAILERSKLPIEQLLQLEYLQFKKFDLSKLIANAVKTQQARSLRERVAGKNTGNSQGINKDNYRKPKDLNITVDDLIDGQQNK